MQYVDKLRVFYGFNTAKQEENEKKISSSSIEESNKRSLLFTDENIHKRQCFANIQYNVDSITDRKRDDLDGESDGNYSAGGYTCDDKLLDDGSSETRSETREVSTDNSDDGFDDREDAETGYKSVQDYLTDEEDAFSNLLKGNSVHIKSDTNSISYIQLKQVMHLHTKEHLRASRRLSVIVIEYFLCNFVEYSTSNSINWARYLNTQGMRRK